MKSQSLFGRVFKQSVLESLDFIKTQYVLFIVVFLLLLAPRMISLLFAFTDIEQLLYDTAVRFFDILVIVGFVMMLTALVQRRPARATRLIGTHLPKYASGVFLVMVRSLLLSFLYLLLIFPGLVYMFFWQFALYVHVYNRKRKRRLFGIWYALSTSKKLVVKHWFVVLCFSLIVWALALLTVGLQLLFFTNIPFVIGVLLLLVSLFLHVLITTLTFHFYVALRKG